jgi:hypothetical protein
MTNGEHKRRKIVRAAAAIFNRRGYEGSSLKDLMGTTSPGPSIQVEPPQVIVEQAQEQRETRTGVDPSVVATVILASLEGAL